MNEIKVTMPSGLNADGTEVQVDAMHCAGLILLKKDMKDYVDRIVQLISDGEIDISKIKDAETVNGHTVESDVPAGAIFTDTVYIHPLESGYKHIPFGGLEKQILTWESDGTAKWEYIDSLVDGLSLKQATSTELGGIKAEPATDEDNTPVHIKEDGTLAVAVKEAKNGATFTPVVSLDGVLSWSNDSGLENPEPVNIKGEQGEQGPQGIQGERGLQGDRGLQGEQGIQGEIGQGVEEMVLEFYLSTSKVEQIDGSWTVSQPTWEANKYLWKRFKVTYKNPQSVVYTVPFVDTSWEFMFCRFG